MEQAEDKEKRSPIIARGEEVRGFLDPSSSDNKDERIVRKYGEKKSSFVWEVESCFYECFFRRDMNIIFVGYEFKDEGGETIRIRGLSGELDRKAKFYANKYKGYGITKDEFEQEFRIEVFRLLTTEQTKGKEMFTFYERVMNAIPHRAVDLVRAYTGGSENEPRNNQRRREFEALPLHMVDEITIEQGTPLSPIRSDMVEQVEAKVLVVQLYNSKMTEIERAVLVTIANDPDISDLQLSKRLGLSYYRAKKLRAKIAERL